MTTKARPHISNEDLLQFSKKLAVVSQRVSELQEKADSAHAETLEEVLSELSTALEELRVADEELHQQNEALLSSYLHLELESQRYRDLFEFAPIGYLISDENGVIREANHAATKLLNLSPIFLISKPFAVFIHEDERPHFRHKLALLRRTPTLLAWEARLKPRHQEPIEVMLTVVPSETSKYDKPSLRWLVYDLSERRKIEAADLEQFFHTTFEFAGVGIAHLNLMGEWMHLNQKMCDFLGYPCDQLMNMLILTFVHKHDRAALNEAIQQVIKGVVQHSSLELCFQHAKQEPRYGQVTLSGVSSAGGKIRYLIIVVEDITQRKEIEEAKRQHQLLTEALTQTAMMLTSSLELGKVLEHILQELARIVPHHAAAVLLVENETIRLTQNRGDLILKDNSPLAQSKIETLLPDNQIHSLDENETAHLLKLLRVESNRFLSAVIAPIKHHDQRGGFLLVLSKVKQFFNQKHHHYLQIFAAQAGAAIQNARSHEQEKALAVQEQRHQFARDLHDAVTQSLFASKVIAESLPHTLQQHPERLSEHLKDLKVLNEGAIAEMRMLLLELKPSQLRTASLSDNLRQLVTALRGRKRIKVILTIEDQHPAPPEVQIAYYRIAQESINNVIKHAQAKHISIYLGTSPAYTLLTIEDDGVGFNIEQIKSGFGINNLRERAEEIGAALSISSRSGKTQVSVLWHPQLDR